MREGGAGGKFVAPEWGVRCHGRSKVGQGMVTVRGVPAADRLPLRSCAYTVNV
jgi:hypothetical protein